MYFRAQLRLRDLVESQEQGWRGSAGVRKRENHREGDARERGTFDATRRLEGYRHDAQDRGTVLDGYGSVEKPS